MTPARTLLWLALAGVALSGRAFGQSIDFIPPAGLQEGQSASVQATFNSGVPPAYAYLFLRGIGQSSFLPLVMRVNGSQLQVEIPKSFLKPPGVEYYLQVVDIDNQTVTFPQTAPTVNPIQLTVAPKPSGFYFKAVYPDEAMTVAEASPLLHVEYTAAGGGLDPSSLAVTVDTSGIPASACQIEPGELFCPVDWELARGTHTVVVEGRSRENLPAPPLKYTFIHGAAAAKRRFSFKGKAVPELVYVHVDRPSAIPALMQIPSNGSRVFPELDLDGSGQYDKLALGLTIRHTGVDRQEQPGPSRYALSVKSDRSSLDAGDFQDSWSDLGLGPTRVRGLRLGHDSGSKAFSVAAFGGETRRAIEIPELNSVVFARSLAGLTAVARWKEKLALRLYGLDGADDAASVRRATFVKPVGSQTAGGELTAGLGYGAKATGELAFVRYKPDLGARDVSRGRAYQLKLAQDASIGSWSAEYRDVNPSFVSLGNAYLQNDYRGVDAQGSVRTPTGSLMLASNVQTYRDNTDGRKVSTIHNHTHQYILNARPYPKGPALTLGFSEQRQNTESAVVANLRNLTRNWTSGLSQTVGAFTCGYTYTLTQFRDLSASAFSDSFDGRFHTVDVSAALAPVTVGATVGFNTNLDLRTGNRTKNVNYALRAKGDYGSLKGELARSGNYGRDTQALVSSRQFNTVAMLLWQATPATFWRARYEEISVANDITASQSYKESRSSLAYGFQF